MISDLRKIPPRVGERRTERVEQNGGTAVLTEQNV